MNVLEGDVEQMAKHFDASLGPLSDREEQDEFVPARSRFGTSPRKKSLSTPTPTTSRLTSPSAPTPARRTGEIQQLVYDLEENHPGTRHSILSGYEELAEIAAEKYAGDDGADLQECVECGSTTTREVCRKCSLLESLA